MACRIVPRWTSTPSTVLRRPARSAVSVSSSATKARTAFSPAMCHGPVPRGARKQVWTFINIGETFISIARCGRTSSLEGHLARPCLRSPAFAWRTPVCRPARARRRRRRPDERTACLHPRRSRGSQASSCPAVRPPPPFGLLRRHLQRDGVRKIAGGIVTAGTAPWAMLWSTATTRTSLNTVSPT